jgi:hypothetical protein
MAVSLAGGDTRAPLPWRRSSPTPPSSPTGSVQCPRIQLSSPPPRRDPCRWCGGVVGELAALPTLARRPLSPQRPSSHTPAAMALLTPIPHCHCRAKPGVVSDGGGAGARWCSRATVRHRLLTCPSELTGPGLSPLCCKCTFKLFQTFYRHVAIVLYGCCKSKSEDVALVAYVTSVSEASCKRLFKLFHLFLDVCCKYFDLDVACVFTYMKCFFASVSCACFECYVCML